MFMRKSTHREILLREKSIAFGEGQEDARSDQQVKIAKLERIIEKQKEAMSAQAATADDYIQDALKWRDRLAKQKAYDKKRRAKPATKAKSKRAPAKRKAVAK